ncbi:hypothetical protein DFJ58DRAFT_376928 [Suillus subalutaceus]|uniref:uncharacterized protein n=1 Tax=Suillus subalutaceus TaxID=48586 RepID=UPI001B876E22|nr:uncharacterized protein DFJ58DRAFT_376928 [Suillus subalutaceus]KAG1854842.1 hypothetical protein DFJ58DRAFT_376928 [Suillus subalutaceus]
MKSTLSNLSAPPNSIRSFPESVAVSSSLAENRPTRKRTNSCLNQDDAHSGRSQSDRPHSVAPATGSPRIDHHKKPRLNSVLPTASAQLRPRTENSPAKHAPDLRESLIADGLTSPARSSVTSNGYTTAPRPKHTTRTPLADILPPLVNHATTRSRKPAAESSSGPGANFPTNIQRMYASSQSGGYPLPSARAHEAIPPASTTIPIRSNVSTTAPQPDNLVLLTANQNAKKTPESAVPPIPPQPISKAIKLEEVIRSPLRCYISIPSSPLSSLSPSPTPAPAQSVLKTQVQHAAGGMARRQVTFATSNQAFTTSANPGPSVPSLPTLDSMSAPMSLRDRRAQMSMVSASTCSRTIGSTCTS